jgi:two-component system, OmpR family, response regulator
MKKIFIVDDDKFYRELLSDYLKTNKLRFDCTFEVQSYQVGELCIDNLHQNPDVIVLDYHLNSKYSDVMNGMELYKEVLSKCKTAKVIFVSSESNLQIVSRLFDFGIEDYIIKNEEAPERLLKSVKDVFYKSEMREKMNMRFKKMKKMFYAAVALAVVELAVILAQTS